MQDFGTFIANLLELPKPTLSHQYTHIYHIMTASWMPRVMSGKVTRQLKCHGWNTCVFNSLWPGDAIWRHGTRSTLAQVIPCCMTAPSHYLNQCWLIIHEVPWHSSGCISIRGSEETNKKNNIENGSFKMASRSPRGQWVNVTHTRTANHSVTASSRSHTNGLVQERRNSIAGALELCLSCTNPPAWFCPFISLYISNQSDYPFLKYRYFRVCTNAKSVFLMQNSLVGT